MTDNQYSTPIIENENRRDTSAASGHQALSQIAWQTFRAWERLRVYYVLMLGLLTISLAGPMLVRFQMIVMIVEGAVVANLCFFAGPILETYVRWLGYEGKWLRPFLFVSGTLLTAFLAVYIMLPMMIPDQD